ncbi:hypothetical protein EVAR_78387_1 [Eumeta japonica]|uniref:Uncharacterized protein n=1 Tax=Eumeta variegata TaxID=151549 RepID=A0A4C1T705_EUMVA|nr:hypothetical protein EVAR_78387_1 [Eumeta japonica]
MSEFEPVKRIYFPGLTRPRGAHVCVHLRRPHPIVEQIFLCLYEIRNNSYATSATSQSPANPVTSSSLRPDRVLFELPRPLAPAAVAVTIFSLVARFLVCPYQILLSFPCSQEEFYYRRSVTKRYSIRGISPAGRRHPRQGQSTRAVALVLSKEGRRHFSEPRKCMVNEMRSRRGSRPHSQLEDSERHRPRERRVGAIMRFCGCSARPGPRARSRSMRARTAATIHLGRHISGVMRARTKTYRRPPSSALRPPSAQTKRNELTQINIGKLQLTIQSDAEHYVLIENAHSSNPQTSNLCVVNNTLYSKPGDPLGTGAGDGLKILAGRRRLEVSNGDAGSATRDARSGRDRVPGVPVLEIFN